MKSQTKILATVLAVALAAGTMSVPASAATDNKKPTIAAIVPAMAGPAILGATIAGPSSTLHTFTIFKKFQFYKWQDWGWYKVKALKYHGFDVHKKFYGHKVKVYASKEKYKVTHKGSNQGKFVVGCVMGSALGAI